MLTELLLSMIALSAQPAPKAKAKIPKSVPAPSSQPKAKPAAANVVACRLLLQSDLDHQLVLMSPNGLKRKNEQMTATLDGTLTETIKPDQSHLFTFQLDPVGPGNKAQLKSVRTFSTAGVDRTEHFLGEELLGQGKLQFEAALRGQLLVPFGYLTVNGKVTLSSGAAADQMAARQYTCAYFPAADPTRAALGRPVLQFQGLSLWGLDLVKAPTQMSATMVFSNFRSAERGIVNGRTSITFDLRPLPRP